ncbi:MAG TPA: RNB domain-containing ribonuclease [Steroidobacteraceae bacterium]|nr:RNB domain-containing ribonuclease [Steroidobacteraceae bacterium]
MASEDGQARELRRLADAAMSARGLLPHFSAAALEQANSLAHAAVESAAAIRDLRALLWSSIDNDDSRDLDQIEYAQAAAGGAVRLLVGIADVDSAVAPGCAIDGHARTNTTSVYTAAQIYPMLPERLSTDLTSLAADQDRLAVVVEATVAADGAVGESAIYRAAVRNKAQLAYRGVAAWLDGAGAAPARVAALAGLDRQLRLQDQAAQALKRRRHEHGALSLETLDARAVFADGSLVDLRPEPKNRAQELIEDLMIAANGVSARFLQQRRVPSLRRVLRTPRRWDRIVALARRQGGHLPAKPDGRALDEFLATRRSAEPERFADLSLAVVKLLGSGEYAVERPGARGEAHFGLAARDYTHSTAPNRRFPDLVTQRLLKAALCDRPGPYGEGELQRLAAHCTQQEDNAAKVERQVRKSAAAMLLQRCVGRQFDAVVTGASAKGTWVRVSKPCAEGRVVEGFQGLDVGDHVRVTLIHTDMARGFIDFSRSR